MGISRFQQAVIHQGEIERTILDFLTQTSRIQVERNVGPETLNINHDLLESKVEYPVTVKVRHGDHLTFGASSSPDEEDSETRISTHGNTPEVDDREEIIKAKYVIGCDGAHSWTRQQLGFTLEGEQTDYIWGVLDIVPLNNFRI